MAAAIFGLWRTWAITVGTLAVLVILSPIVPIEWLMIFNVVSIILLNIMANVLSDRDIPFCSRLPKEVAVVLFINLISLIIVYIVGKAEGVVELNGQPFDRSAPIAALLVISPISTIVTLYFLLQKGLPHACMQCRRRYGNVIEHGFVGDLYRREWKFQTRLLFLMALALTVVGYIYYFTWFININFNRTDLFFFVWMPMAVYVLSLIYLGNRYYSLWIYYCQNDEARFVARPGQSIERFLIICGDRILLHFYPTPSNYPNQARIKKFDTPAVVVTDYHERESHTAAVINFKEKTGISDADIKFVYSSPDRVTFHNIFHYFAFVDDPAIIADSKINGEWMTWPNVMQLSRHGLLDRDIIAEFDRIYRVVMAWKTYDADGRRLYKIKHYKPTFRLRDLKNWQVNYDDADWLRVAANNEDSFWYPIRRLFSAKSRKVKSEKETSGQSKN